MNASEAFLDDAIARFGADRPAITRVKGTERESLTYRDVLRRVAQTVAGLDDLGVCPGDGVLLRMPFVPETGVVQLAVWRLGAVTVPSSVLEASSELTYMLNDSVASVVVAASEYVGPLEKALAETPAVRQVVGWPAAVAGGPTLADIRVGKPQFFEPYATSARDASGIYYTGGTTGLPEACLHTHVAEIWNADLTNAARGADETWVFLIHAPTGHAFGCLEKLNLTLRAGASVIYMDRPAPADMSCAVLDLGVTSIGVAATMYRMMLADHAWVEELHGVPLKSAYSAGEALDPATQERWGELMPVPLRSVVAMTPMRGIFLESNQDGVKTAAGLAVGLPPPGYEARLITETGTAAAAGEPARLAMRVRPASSTGTSTRTPWSVAAGTSSTAGASSMTPTAATRTAGSGSTAGSTTWSSRAAARSRRWRWSACSGPTRPLPRSAWSPVRRSSAGRSSPRSSCVPRTPVSPRRSRPDCRPSPRSTWARTSTRDVWSTSTSCPRTTSARSSRILREAFKEQAAAAQTPVTT